MKFSITLAAGITAFLLIQAAPVPLSLPPIEYQVLTHTLTESAGKPNHSTLKLTSADQRAQTGLLNVLMGKARGEVKFVKAKPPKRKDAKKGTQPSQAPPPQKPDEPNEPKPGA